MTTKRQTPGTIPVFCGAKATASEFLDRLTNAGLGKGTRVLPTGNSDKYLVLVTRQTLRKRVRIMALANGAGRIN